MDTLSEHKSLVNEQLTFHEGRAKAYADAHPARAAKHKQTAERLRELLAYLDGLPPREATSTAHLPNRPAQLRLSLRAEDLDGLPQELLDELSTSGAENKTEATILTLLQEAGGVMSLDQLLVGLFRRAGELHKRPALTNRLYRMAQKGLIFSVPGKKGAYSDTRLTEQDAAELFGELPKESDPSEDGS